MPMHQTSSNLITNMQLEAKLQVLESNNVPPRSIDQSLIDTLASPALLGPFLDLLLQKPWPAIEQFIDCIGDYDDPRGVQLLAPLLHSSEESIAILAVDAVGRLGATSSRDALQERITFDRREAVRDAAMRAMDQLQDGMVTPTKGASQPLYFGHLTVIDGAGGQMALVARKWNASRAAILHVVFNDTAGIVDCFGSPDESLDELTDELDDLEDDGLTPIELSLEEIRNTIYEAYQKSLRTLGRAPVGFVAWRPFLSGDDPREFAPVTAPKVAIHDNYQPVAESYELLNLDEFGSWYFEASDIQSAVEQVRKLQRDRGTPKYETRLVGLIRQTLRDVLVGKRIRLYQRRLARQAVYLARISEDDTYAIWAQAAAAALDEDAGYPASEHPLFQEMLVRSLEHHLGQPLLDDETY